MPSEYDVLIQGSRDILSKSRDIFLKDLRNLLCAYSAQEPVQKLESEFSLGNSA